MRNGLRQSYVGRFAPLRHSLGFRHITSDLPLLRLSSQVLRNQKVTLHSLVHLFLGDGPTISLHRVCLDVCFARGVTLPLTRGVGSQTSRLTMRANRLQVANNGTMSRPTRRIFVLLLWHSSLTTSRASFQPPPSPWPSLPPDDFTSLRLQVWWKNPLNCRPISPGLNIYDSPANRLSRRSLRADRCLRLCPLSRGPKRCLTRLAKGRSSKLTLKSTT